MYGRASEYAGIKGNGMTQLKHHDITENIIDTIKTNAQYLSEIDGAIGDGDHGINLRKGILMAEQKMTETLNLSEELAIIATTLFDDMGGSMGPLYGIFFREFSQMLRNTASINEAMILETLIAIEHAIKAIGGAEENDKTLLDALTPGRRELEFAIDRKESFNKCLTSLKEGAHKGAQQTKAMQAKVGRASRLGPRSIGHLDPGAVSCSLIIASICDSLMENKPVTASQSV